ncbi:DUF6397 family protein [Streptomyces sp. NPDC004327]|uniref:DUF6397 family protein n=1 Tax=Streptomyces sp. NPDC004327 TaxID=3364699 RepID=UPI0036AAD1BD
MDLARRRVRRAEIDRLRTAEDFPAGLHERVRTVGTNEGAALLAITTSRFARLARTGHFSPARFYVNRYRAVVWLYPAAELGEFAIDHPGLLAGRFPLDVREREEECPDWRPRNWRARRLGMLLRAHEDPWVRTAAIASLLDSAHLAEVVDDPFERAYLTRLRPAPPTWRPVSPVARETFDRMLLADDPDEILWHRMSLALALDEARADRDVPRPGAVRPVSAGLAAPAHAPAPMSTPTPTPTTTTTTTSAPAPAPASARVSLSAPAFAPGPAPAFAPGPVPAPTVRPEPRAVSAPGRPPTGVRPPGRRVRRGLLDRLRGRKAARSRGE